MWLIMVNMEPMGVSTSGLLSVVARNYPESPEEQYDRLVRYFHEIVIFPCRYCQHDRALRLCLWVPPLSVENAALYVLFRTFGV